MKTILAIAAALFVTTVALAETADDVECIACVEGSDMGAGAVGTKHLVSGAIRTNKIRDEAVTGAKLSEGAVDVRNLSEDLKSALGDAGSVQRMKLVDAGGALVGFVTSMELAGTDESVSDSAMVWVEVAGEAILLKLIDNRLRGFDGSAISFATGDCSGSPYATPAGDSALTDYGSLRVTRANTVWRSLPGTTEKRLVRSRQSTTTGFCSTVPHLEISNLSEEIGRLPAFAAPFRIVFE